MQHAINWKKVLLLSGAAVAGSALLAGTAVIVVAAKIDKFVKGVEY